jgi:hypothetical protein
VIENKRPRQGHPGYKEQDHRPAHLERASTGLLRDNAPNRDVFLHRCDGPQMFVPRYAFGADYRTDACGVGRMICIDLTMAPRCTAEPSWAARFIRYPTGGHVWVGHREQSCKR